MSVNYYALGKTNWQAIRLEDFRGARGRRLNGLDEIGPVYLETDRIYDEVCRRAYGEYRFVYWPSHLLTIFMKRFGEENPDGVEYWANDCISEYDEPKPGSFGWLNGNHGKPLEYVHFRDMWEISDRYVPELREPENMKIIFGALCEDYLKALKAHNAKASVEIQSPSIERKSSSLFSIIKSIIIR